MSDPTPILSRVDALHDQWVRFAETPSARLLLWRASSDERALIEAFIARECAGETASSPDLFVVLTAPFESVERHALTLRTELAARYEEATAALGEEVESRWTCPAPRGSDVGDLLDALASLRAHLCEHGSDVVLAVWLDPDDVASTQGYQLWLQRLAREAPSGVRFIVVDDADDPRLEPLAKLEPQRALAVCCALALPAALPQLASQAGSDLPGDRFRVLHVELSARLAAGDLTGASAIGAAALALVTAHRWWQLGAALQLSLAAAHMAHAQPEQALAAYGEAERMAQACEADEAGEAGEGSAAFGLKLRLQAQLGRASVLLAERAHAAAADAYLAAAALARATSDPRTEFDCLRLSARCYGELGDHERAWQSGSAGLELAESIDEEARKSSTLPYLADQLLRLTETRPEYRANRGRVAQQVEQLLGREWRAALRAGDA